MQRKLLYVSYYDILRRQIQEGWDCQLLRLRATHARSQSWKGGRPKYVEYHLAGLTGYYQRIDLVYNRLDAWKDLGP